MMYLAGQIFLWMALTFAVAFVFGWWLRGKSRGQVAEPTPTGDESEIEGLARERNELEGRCGRMSKTVDGLEKELEAARSRILALEMEREDGAETLRDEGSLQTSTIAGAVDPFSDPPSMVLVAPDGPLDDLRQIKGLGKILEMRLHELGIFHYRQLAGLEGYDFNWLAAKLGFSPARLDEMSWVAQARGFATDAGPDSQEDDLVTLPGVELPPSGTGS